jgi:hypothetical protein
MRTIQIEFLPFREINLRGVLKAVGVYVIWDAHAKARPTYIGEGNILRRLTDHVSRNGRTFAHPWDGYIGVISGSTANVHKGEAKTVERLFLDIARATDRFPSENKHPGSAATVFFSSYKELLRVVVVGYDPLIPPREARELSRPKEIKVRQLPDGNASIHHDWRRRRLRRAP